MFIGGFIRGLETILEPDQVEIVKKELLTGANKLDRGEFQNLNVAAVRVRFVRGRLELGFHHGRAHQVIADTLAGVTADMRDFREGVVKAEVMLEDADTGAAVGPLPQAAGGRPARRRQPLVRGRPEVPPGPQRARG